jgi:hypothetical protein
MYGGGMVAMPAIELLDHFPRFLLPLLQAKAIGELHARFDAIIVELDRAPQISLGGF